MPSTHTNRVWREIRRKYIIDGVPMCSRWHTYRNFRDDMGEIPDDMNIAMIDENGCYERFNCKIVSMTEHHCNRKNAVIVEYRGERKNLSDWCHEFGVNVPKAYARLKAGFDLDVVFGLAEKPKRDYKNARMVMFNGERLSLSAVADRTGINYSTLLGRINRGYTVEQAVARGRRIRKC